MDYFLAIDFDGTIADRDVTDAVLEQFAEPEWEFIEKQWEAGIFGSQECLRRQMALVKRPLTELLEFVSTISIDPSFRAFVQFAQREKIPMAIISDGFEVFIQRILEQNGLQGLAVYANTLKEHEGAFMTSYPHNSPHCPSGTCKCQTAEVISGGLPVYLIGDGRSDFCLAKQADFVYAKAKLVDFCEEEGLDYCVYRSFQEIQQDLRVRQKSQAGIA
ncbi:MAG: MtnX-like HAD-IB family phosphatase [Sporomusaceae bacterium]|nr:MtnX-like HAD-IB family phosphatase [Sporomusaceae bacterium]